MKNIIDIVVESLIVRDHKKLVEMFDPADLESKVRAGAFDTLETCEDRDYIEELGYAKLYAKSMRAGECTVLWRRKLPTPEMAPTRSTGGQ